MNSWRVCTFYTVDTGYELEVKKLKRSLERFNIPAHIRGVSSLGSWQKNTMYKAKFIGQMMDKFQGEDIVWLDADAIVRSRPTLFDTLDGDIACHFRNWKHGRDELLSGTLFLKNNKQVRRVIRDWISLNARNSNNWEQRNLARVIKRYGFNLKVYKLPLEYCFIFDDENRGKIKPVIEHFQVSRKYRRAI